MANYQGPRFVLVDTPYVVADRATGTLVETNAHGEPFQTREEAEAEAARLSRLDERWHPESSRCGDSARPPA